MKKTILMLAIAMASYSTYAQTNTFPSSGNVGVGTTSPTLGKLQINGSDDLVTLYSNGGTAQFNAYNNTDFRIIQRENAVMTLWTNTVERMRINQYGNVGIGTTSPVYNLDVAGTTRIGNNSDGASLILNGKFSTSFNYTLDTRIGNYLSIVSGAPGATPFVLDYAGNVGIGTTTPDTKLAVNGAIHAKEVKVDLTGWPDYVFKPTYALPSLNEIKTYINKNRHLPEIPSEQEVIKNGINLGEVNKLLLKKIEELTLYLIEENRRNQDQHNKLEQQDKRIATLERALLKLTASK